MTATDILAQIVSIERVLRSIYNSTLDWQTDSNAVAYRQLMRDWWNLPSADAMKVLYASNEPIRNRLLTGKTTIPDRPLTPYVRLTPTEKKTGQVIRRLNGAKK